MNEDAVELAPESYVAHVALNVLALGIQLTTDLEHAVGKIHQRHLEALLEIRGVVAAAAAELEQCAQRTLARVLELPLINRRFFRVIDRSGENRPRRSELRVELRLARSLSGIHLLLDVAQDIVDVPHSESNVLHRQTLIVSVHALLSFRLLGLERIDGVSDDAQLAIRRTVGRARLHRRSHERVRLALLRSTLDSLEQIGVDGTLERRLQ